MFVFFKKQKTNRPAYNEDSKRRIETGKNYIIINRN